MLMKKQKAGINFWRSFSVLRQNGSGGGQSPAVCPQRDTTRATFLRRGLHES
jgi:hypothetical protein